MRRILGVVFGFVAVVLVLALAIGPFVWIVERNAFKRRVEMVETVSIALKAEATTGELAALLFPEWSSWPTAKRRTPMRDARCLTEVIPQMPDGITARAVLCVTADRSAKRMFYVGISWQDPAPIRGHFPKLKSWADALSLPFLWPQSHGELLVSETWPAR